MLWYSFQRWRSSWRSCSDGMVWSTISNALDESVKSHRMAGPSLWIWLLSRPSGHIAQVGTLLWIHTGMGLAWVLTWAWSFIISFSSSLPTDEATMIHLYNVVIRVLLPFPLLMGGCYSPNIELWWKFFLIEDTVGQWCEDGDEFMKCKFDMLSSKPKYLCCFAGLQCFYMLSHHLYTYLLMILLLAFSIILQCD